MNTDPISYNGKIYASPREAAADLYLSGASVHRIAYILGCSTGTVYNRLKEAGITKETGRSKKVWKADMRRFFRNKAGMRENP